MSGNQEDLSSDDDYDHVRIPGIGINFSKDREDLHRTISKMKEVPFSEYDAEFMSPIGSPSQGFTMGSPGRFQELKRKLEEDQANAESRERGDTDTDSPEAIDVSELLDMIHSENQEFSSMSSISDNHPKFTEMYRQIKERDHKILDLEARVNELDRQAVDLQDSINQRDKLINSKNEAVSVVHNKYRKELEQKEEETRKTQQTMFDLEKNLSGIQDRFNQEKNRLIQQVESIQQKMEILRENTQVAEVKAQALEAKTQVLEDEVSRLRAEKGDLSGSIAQKDALLLSKDSKITELTGASDKLETTLKKLKMQFQNKLKAFKEKQTQMQEELKGLERVGELETKNAELENQIAELEEEKGSLLLQKMESEETNLQLQEKLQARAPEHSASFDSLKLEYEELVENCKQLSNEVQQLKEEKIEAVREVEFEFETNLTEKEMEAQATITDLTNCYEILQAQLREVQQQKQLAESESQFELTFLKTELAEYREKYETVLQENERLTSEAIAPPNPTPAFVECVQSASAAVIDFADWSDQVDTTKDKLGQAGEDVERSEDGWSNFGWGEPETVEEPITAVTKVSMTSESSAQPQSDEHAEDREKEIENLRNELEKLVFTAAEVQSLKLDVERLEKERDDFHATLTAKDELLLEKESKMEGLRTSVTNLETTLKKIKSQFQSKLKALKQKKQARDVLEDSSEEVVPPSPEHHQVEISSKPEDVNQISALKDEVEQVKGEKELLVTKLTSCEASLLNCTTELESIKWEYQGLQGNCQELTDEISRLTSLVEETRNQVEVEDSHLPVLKLQMNLEISEGRVHDLEGEIQKLKDDMVSQEAIEAKLQERSDELESLKWEYEETIENCKQLSNEILKLNAEKGEAMHEIEVKFMNQLTEKESQIQDAQNTVSNLAKNLEISEAKIHDLETAAQKLRNEVQFQQVLEAKHLERTEEFESLKRSYAESSENYERLSSEILKLNAEKVEARRSIETEFEAEVLKTEALAQDAQRTIGDLTKYLEISEGRINELELQARKDVQFQEELEEKLKKCTEELYSLKIDYQGKVDVCNQLSSEIQKLNEEKYGAILQVEADFGRKLAEKEVHAQEARDTISELRMTIERSQERIQELETEMQQFQDKIKSQEELETKLQERTNDLESLRWEYEENMENCKHLSEAIVKLNAEKVEAVRETQVHFQTALAEKETKVQEAQNTISELNQNYEIIQGQLSDLEAQKQLTESQSLFEVNFLKTELAEYREKYETVLQENERLASQTNAQQPAAAASAGTETDVKGAAILDFVDWNDHKDKEEDGWSTNFGWGEPEVVEEPVVAKKPFLTNEIAVQAGEHDAGRDREMETLRNECLKLDSNADALEEEIYRLQKERDEFLDKLAKKDALISDQESTVEELKASVTTLESTLKKMKAQFQAKLKALRDTQTGPQETGPRDLGGSGSRSPVDERKSPDDQNPNSPRAGGGDEELISTLRHEIVQAKEEKVALANKLSSCEVSFHQASTELESIKWDYQGLQETCEELNREIGRLTLVIEGSGSSAESTRQLDLEAKVQELQIANSSILELRKNLELREERIQELSAEAQKLRLELTSSEMRQNQLISEHDAQLEILLNEFANYKEFTEPSISAYQSRIGELQHLLEVAQNQAAVVPPPLAESTGVTTNEAYEAKLVELERAFDLEQHERAVLERKVELLQGKIHEIEEAEMKCYGETLLLKSWTRELEIDNQKKQTELDLYRNAGGGDVRNIKATILQEEVMRLVNELQDRDARCEGLTNEITRLLEERDGLQLKLSTVLTRNISLHEEANKGKEVPEGEVPSYDRETLQLKLGELEDINYAINMDLRREREARRLVQEQLFFSQSTRGYGGGTTRNRSPTFTPSTPTRTPSRSTVTTPMPSPSSSMLSPPPSAHFVPTISPLPYPPPPPLSLNSSQIPTPDGPPFPNYQFQTVDLDNNGANVSQVPQPPPSPVMRI